MKNSVYDSMSNAELQICEFLQELHIFWTYEQPVFLTDDGFRPRIFCPDFYLPELGIYIEVIGNPGLNDYSRREEIYAKNNIQIIFISPFNHIGWREYLVEKIVMIHQDRYNKILRIKDNYKKLNKKN